MKISCHLVKWKFRLIEVILWRNDNNNEKSSNGFLSGCVSVEIWCWCATKNRTATKSTQFNETIFKNFNIESIYSCGMCGCASSIHGNCHCMRWWMAYGTQAGIILGATLLWFCKWQLGFSLSKYYLLCNLFNLSSSLSSCSSSSLCLRHSYLLFIQQIILLYTHIHIHPHTHIEIDIQN